jgi:glycosyltransferase involved in cell wall biosynthesis
MSLATRSPPRLDRLQPGGELRVLLVTQASGGGAGRHFLDLAAGLVAKGVRVAGIYAPRKLDALFRQRLAEEELPPLHELPMRRAIHPLDVVDLYRMIRLIRRLGPFDIVHGHSSKGGALARLAGRWLGVPSVYTPHALVTLDPNLGRPQRLIYGRIERWLARSTAAIIAVSEDEAIHARELGLDPRKIHVVPNGIDPPIVPSRATVRARLGLAPHDFVLGFVGRLTPQKNPELLVEAMALLAAQHPQAKLVMVGSGPLEASVRHQIARLGVEDRVLLLGDVVGAAIMPAFDVFCLSSRYEGMPYVLLEALAAGLPIVATAVGGVTMCVEPRHNGFIVEPGSAEAFAAALSPLAADPLVHQSCAQNSLAKAVAFSIDRMIVGTRAVYEQALRRVPQPIRS